MLPDYQSLTWMLVGMWFVVYWIFGGVFFALVAAARFVNTRKAMFSCLFTIGSGLAAYGAAVGGMLLGRPNTRPACMELAYGKTLGLTQLLSCNYPAILVAGAMCFSVLLMAGLLAMLISRVEKTKEKELR